MILSLAAVCNRRHLDLYFVLDASGSVGLANFQEGLDFVEGVARNFHIALNATRVGVIRFATSAQIMFSLNTYNNVNTLSNAIQGVEYISGGSTDTAEALDLLVSQAFTEANGARPLEEAILRVAIVITDGQSSSITSTILAAQRVCQSNITVAAVGVGNNINANELNSIACNQPGFVFEIASFGSEQRLVEQLSDELCNGKNFLLS